MRSVSLRDGGNASQLTSCMPSSQALNAHPMPAVRKSCRRTVSECNFQLNNQQNGSPSRLYSSHLINAPALVIIDHLTATPGLVDILVERRRLSSRKIVKVASAAIIFFSGCRREPRRKLPSSSSLRILPVRRQNNAAEILGRWQSAPIEKIAEHLPAVSELMRSARSARGKHHRHCEQHLIAGGHLATNHTRLQAAIHGSGILRCRARAEAIFLADQQRLRMTNTCFGRKRASAMTIRRSWKPPQLDDTEKRSTAALHQPDGVFL